MNKQGRKRRYSSIGWTDQTWNPIKGMCPRACKLPDGKEYCYGRDFYRRILNEKYCGETEGENLIFLSEPELCKPYSLKEPSRIFVCSTFELFHPHTKWMRDAIFTVIKENPRHTFQILTKMPENIDRPMPHNVWLGVTNTGIDRDACVYLWEKHAKIKFASFEPLLYEPYFSKYWTFLDWIIVGKLTRHGKKYDPKIEWIQRIIDVCEDFDVPVFLKDNLRGIWEGDLIQEFPG